MYASQDYRIAWLWATDSVTFLEALAQFHSLARGMGMMGNKAETFTLDIDAGHAEFRIVRRPVVASRPLTEQLCPN